MTEARMETLSDEAIRVAEEVWTEDEPSLAEYELTERILNMGLAAERERTESLLRLAQHLADQIVAEGRCELTAFPEDPARTEAWAENRGRCSHKVVAIRWENGFADSVCERHAQSAEDRGAIIVRPKRHDGTTRTGVQS